jgi:hypothetical protein
MDNTDQSINLILSTQSTCTLATVHSFLSQNLPIRTSYHKAYQSELLITKLINHNVLSQSLSIIASYHRTYQSELLITELTNQSFLYTDIIIEVLIDKLCDKKF